MSSLPRMLLLPLPAIPLLVAMRTPAIAKDSLCATLSALYQQLVTANPEAPYDSGFYAQSPLTLLGADAKSGVSITPHMTRAGKDMTPQQWLQSQSPPVALPQNLLDRLRSSDFLEQLPGTNFYAASRLAGLASCHQSVYFEMTAREIKAAAAPRNWNGPGCNSTRAFGKIGATPVAFEEIDNETPALAASLSVSAWTGKGFGQSCSVHFQFEPRFGARGSYHEWRQSCHGANCDELRGAALNLVALVQANPTTTEKTLLDDMTPAQIATYQAARGGETVAPATPVPADPGALTVKSPIILPLVSGGRLYLAELGHFKIGRGVVSDWSVKVDAIDGKDLDQIAVFAIGMTKGKLVKAEVK